MTDPVIQKSYPVPDEAIVDPCKVRNGNGFINNHHPQNKNPDQPEMFTTEMKITDNVEGEGKLISHCHGWKCFSKLTDVKLVFGCPGRQHGYFYLSDGAYF